MGSSRIDAGRGSGLVFVVALLAVLAPGGQARADFLGEGKWIARVVGSGPFGADPPFDICARLEFSAGEQAPFGVPVDGAGEIGAFICRGVATLASGESVPSIIPTSECVSEVNGALSFKADIGLVRDRNSVLLSWVSERLFSFKGGVASRLAFDSLAMDGKYTSSLEGLGDAGACGSAAISFYGTFKFNVFRAVPTTEGNNVSVSTGTTYVNPLTGKETAVNVDIGFASVEGPGTTLVTAVSNVSGTVSGNFATDAGGFRPTYIDVTTTAPYTPPLTICTSYEDLDNDGIVDGTTVPESALSFLHQENGTFVDRTVLRDPEANRICAQVDSLSYLVVLVRSDGVCAVPGEACDDGNACTSADTCNANLDCVGSGAADCDDGIECTLDECVAPAGCRHTSPPAPECLEGSKTQLVVGQSSRQVDFKWQGGPLDKATFGDPTASGGYSLCVFDANGLYAHATAPAGCDSGTCWNATRAGFKFKSKAGVGGLTAALLGAGEAGKAKMQAKGKGPNVDLARPGIKLGPPVEVRLVQEGTPFCVRSGFAKSAVSKNDAKKFVAKTKP